MSGYYNNRPYPMGGPIAKKAKMAPRVHQMTSAQPYIDDGKRLQPFKDFMSLQSRDISDQEAIAKYAEYKTDFYRKQIDRFFNEHKEEEWFRNKYRPTEIKKIEDALKESKAKRKEIFNKLIERQNPEEFFLDHSHKDQVHKFLYSISLLLEGATMEEIENSEGLDKYAVSSIYIPGLHPSIDKSMVEEYAATHPGFLRVATSEAQPEKSFRRRAWITYRMMDHDSLQKLCWQFNNHKFNGQETRAVINKEMNSRLQYANHWFCHTNVTKADLKNVSKILTHYEGEDCLLLDSMKEHLIEETNEEERVLGLDEQDVSSFEFTQDGKLLKVLDKIILYLRVVHSFDYYACTEYTGEDDMPEKIGLMFVRPKITENPDENAAAILKEFVEAHEQRVEQFLDKQTFSEAEQKSLGKKDVDSEIENFIYLNTTERIENQKYVCKLTKKKFTSVEFVRKHIYNRCGDKLDEVRTEAQYFNNYVADPKRPM